MRLLICNKIVIQGRDRKLDKKKGVTDRDADGPTEQAQQKGTAEVLRREARFLAWNQPGLQNHTEQEGL